MRVFYKLRRLENCGNLIIIIIGNCSGDITSVAA